MTPKACCDMSSDLFCTDSIDLLDSKIRPRDGVQMHESDKGLERSRYFYAPKALDAAKRLYLTNAVEKQRLEEKQLDLYQTGE
jgi:hypothetical protein